MIDIFSYLLCFFYVTDVTITTRDVGGVMKVAEQFVYLIRVISESYDYRTTADLPILAVDEPWTLHFQGGKVIDYLMVNDCQLTVDFDFGN